LRKYMILCMKKILLNLRVYINLSSLIKYKKLKQYV
jgi:hypothetical protein